LYMNQYIIPNSITMNQCIITNSIMMNQYIITNSIHDESVLYCGLHNAVLRWLVFAAVCMIECSYLWTSHRAATALPGLQAVLVDVSVFHTC
jgi:hypothetical protein